MTQTVQPRYRNPWLVLFHRLQRRKAANALTIGAKGRASGGDYSHWNGMSGFHPQNGTPGLSDFAIGKITEGIGYVDPSFAVNWPGYEWHPVRGAYHYARSQYSGIAQAEHLLRQLAPYPGVNFIGYDFESVGNTFTTGFMVETYRALQTIQANHPAKLYLYTNRSLREWLRNESLKYYGEDVFLQYGFWYAAPLFAPSPDANPVLPVGVPGWDFYQYIWAFDGRQVGIDDSTIDYNVYKGNRDQLLLDFGVTSDPPGDDMNLELIRSELDKLAAARDVITLAEAAIRAEIDGTPPPPDPFTAVYTCTADNLHIRQTPGGVTTGKYLHRGETCKVDPTKDTLVGTTTWHYHNGGPSGQAGWSSGTYLKKA